MNGTRRHYGKRKSGKFYSKHVDIILCKVRRIIVDSFLFRTPRRWRQPGKEFLYPLLCRTFSHQSYWVKQNYFYIKANRFRYWEFSWYYRVRATRINEKLRGGGDGVKEKYAYSQNVVCFPRYTNLDRAKKWEIFFVELSRLA